MEAEITKLGTKHRYEKMCQGDTVKIMSESEMIAALKEIDKERERERLERQVLKDGDFDLSRIRPTEMKFNTRIHPPNEATSSSEAAIKVHEDAIRRCIVKYISDTTQDTILSDKERIGKESIKKRIADGEVLLTFTDKDGQSVLCSPSIYQ